MALVAAGDQAGAVLQRMLRCGRRAKRPGAHQELVGVAGIDGGDSEPTPWSRRISVDCGKDEHGGDNYGRPGLLC
jgi:hypothetical protein